MHKVLSSAKSAYDLSIDFDANRDNIQQEITNIKTINWKYKLGSMLRHAYGFLERQEKAIFGLGFELT